jgi:heptosyltransferase II
MNYKRVLVIKLSALGDVLATTPVFSSLKNNCPNSDVDHLVMRNCAAVTENNPFVSRQVIVKNTTSGNVFYLIFKALLLIIHLRKNKYDLAILLHTNFFFRILLKLSNIKNIIGFTGNGPLSSSSFFLKYYLPYNISDNRSVLEFKLLYRANIVNNSCGHLEYYPNSKKDGFELVPFNEFGFITCCVGGGNIHSYGSNKFFSTYDYAKVFNNLDFPIVFLGSGIEDEILTIKTIKRIGNTKFVNLVNKTTLDDAAIILGKSAVYIGNDSGLIYLASSQKVKTLGLYGPTSSIAYNPIGSRNSVIIAKTECSPCYDPFKGLNGEMYQCQKNICMSSISHVEVEKKLRALIYD